MYFQNNWLSLTTRTMDEVNFKAIYDGYKNYVFPTKNMEALAAERAKICSTCPHIEPNGILKVLMPDKRTRQIKGARCKLCKCPLSAKVRTVLSECPDNPKRW